MSPRGVAKWLGIYVICNLITLAALVVIFLLSSTFSPPMSSQRAVAIAKMRMEEDYLRTRFRKEHSTECTLGNGPEDAIRDEQAYDVTCSIFSRSYVVARTTFIFSREGLAGQDDWELDGRVE